jgi:hypothetical protein
MSLVVPFPNFIGILLYVKNHFGQNVKRYIFCAPRANNSHNIKYQTMTIVQKEPLDDLDFPSTLRQMSSPRMMKSLLHTPSDALPSQD